MCKLMACVPQQARGSRRLPGSMQNLLHRPLPEVAEDFVEGIHAESFCTKENANIMHQLRASDVQQSMGTFSREGFRRSSSALQKLFLLTPLKLITMRSVFSISWALETPGTPNQVGRCSAIASLSTDRNAGTRGTCQRGVICPCARRFAQLLGTLSV